MLVAKLGDARPPSLDLRVVAHPGTRAHVLRVRFDVRLSGVRGTMERMVDLDDGRYVERTTAGPLSSAEGFDGRRFWSTDATGIVALEDHPDDVVDDRAWARFSGYTGLVAKTTILSDSRTRSTIRYSYSGLSGPIDVTFARATGRPAYVVDRSGVDYSFARFDEYRRSRGVILPYREVYTSRYATTVQELRSLDVLRDVPSETFAVPRQRDDFTLSGSTSLPMSLAQGVPIVDVRIGAGPRLHMMFDSGGAYSLTNRAAARLGLRLTGHDFTGGIGANVEAERYATVRSVRIGRAELRDQIIPVFDSTIFDVDGAIGCEVLRRFAVRFDFVRKRVILARDASSLHPRGPAIAIRLKLALRRSTGRSTASRAPSP